MKTRLLLFVEELPPEIATRAIKNTEEASLLIKFEAIDKAIESAFVWSESPEGSCFWRDVFLQHGGSFE